MLTKNEPVFSCCSHNHRCLFPGQCALFDKSESVCSLPSSCNPSNSSNYDSLSTVSADNSLECKQRVQLNVRQLMNENDLKKLSDLPVPFVFSSKSTAINYTGFNRFRKYSVDNLTLQASAKAFLHRNSVDSLKKSRSTHAKLTTDQNSSSNLPEENDETSDRISEASSKSASQFSNLTKQQRFALTCILIVCFCSYASMSIIAPFFPKKANEKGLNESQSGLVFSVFALTSVFCSPLLGKLVPVFGAKLMIILGTFICGASNLMFGLAGDLQDKNVFFISCLVIRMFEAFGTCCHSTASYTYVIKLFPEKLGFVFGLTETFVGIGLSLGPGVGGFLYGLGGYILPFYVFGIIVLLCIPFIWYFLNDQGLFDEDLVAIKNTPKCQNVTYWQLLKMPKNMVISIVIVVMSTSQSFLEPTVEPHLRQFHLSSEMVGIEFLLFSTSYAISTPIVGHLGSKVGNKFHIMLSGTLITIVGLLLVGPCRLFTFLTPSLWISTVGLIVIGFGFGIAFIPTFESMFSCCLEAQFADNVNTYGKVSGMWSCLFSIGEVLGPLLGGFITYHFDFQEAASIVALICLITVPLLVAMSSKSCSATYPVHTVSETGHLKVDQSQEIGVSTIECVVNQLQLVHYNTAPSAECKTKVHERTPLIKARSAPINQVPTKSSSQDLN